MFFSEGRGHLTELARNAVDGGATLLVVVGGDGSLHEVADGVVGRDVEVAVLMRGTGMDFRAHVRDPHRRRAGVRRRVAR